MDVGWHFILGEGRGREALSGFVCNFCQHKPCK